MTNPTPHGQVPEALIDLIDAYAETRHRYGGVYNAKTEAARNAVIEALSGVQALSAAPARDERVPEAWTNLLAYVLQDDLHNRLTPRVIDIAYTAFNLAKQPNTEDGGSSDWFTDTKPTINKMIAKLRKDLIEDRAASPTPPAEQQAQTDAVYAELPEPDFGPGRYLGKAIGDAYTKDQMRNFADRTHAARLRCKSEQARLATLWGYVRADATTQQAAPKAAPVEQDDHQILAITTAYEQGVGKGHQAYNSGKEIANPYCPAYRCDLAWQYGYKEGKEQAQREAKAAPEVGNSGFDYKTAADFLIGKTISDEAVHKFVAASRWAHDERSALSATLLAMRGVLASREAEIALLKKALMEAEAAPKQEAQKSVVAAVSPAFVYAGERGSDLEGLLDGYDHGTAFYTASNPAPAPRSETPYEKRKATQEGEQIGASDAWFKARHEMLDTLDRRNVFRAGFDRGWSAALAAQGGKDA